MQSKQGYVDSATSRKSYIAATFPNTHKQQKTFVICSKCMSTVYIQLGRKVEVVAQHINNTPCRAPKGFTHRAIIKDHARVIIFFSYDTYVLDSYRTTVGPTLDLSKGISIRVGTSIVGLFVAFQMAAKLKK